MATLIGLVILLIFYVVIGDALAARASSYKPLTEDEERHLLDIDRPYDPMSKY